MFSDSSDCCICGQPLSNSDRGYLTIGGCDFSPEDETLSRFCQGPLHWACYEDWPDRPRFARQYVLSKVESLSDNPFWGLALITDLVCVTARKKEPGLAQVWLFETGTCVEVALADWSEWLSNLSLTQEDLDRVDVVSLWQVLPTLRDRLPTSDTVLVSIDWDAKAELAKAQEEEQTRIDQARRDAIAAHNAACREFMTACEPERLMCPHCQSKDIEFVDRGRFCFVCQDCGRSFGHDL